MRNKYFVSAAAFVIWLAFIDSKNFISQYELSSEVNKLESQKSFFMEEIVKTRKEQEELLSSPDKLEKFAREKYLMKKDDEDLFIFTEEQ
ncbi:FtsB family cell division protein [Chitinophaga sancti]|uniref:Septum formation initiator n=1 Tax=Chitinophaga sancti TaxID=1004 RepID=A0A1K1SA54_9BACT|nr:septum formation initiator family protein [Chitinophaga sancti]WQD60875.1 septum formation initiator family protein [Chitinophaga sancti]WQG86997.1 septum formation initiator family protein [Chitinophaga sancti]SFW81243.1 Septum formation initiator [Chitinophaga sancti]